MISFIICFRKKMRRVLIYTRSMCLEQKAKKALFNGLEQFFDEFHEAVTRGVL